MNEKERTEFLNGHIFATATSLVEFVLSYTKKDKEYIPPFKNKDVENYFNEELLEYNYVNDWLVISRELLEFLRLEGEVVLDNESIVFWGRTTYGQNLYCDEVLEKFCENRTAKKVGRPCLGCRLEKRYVLS